jgi:hypothetical protein
VKGPGLAKVRAPPLLAARRALLLRACSPRWLELFDRADIMSEGSVRDELGGRVWYGSTSLILSVPPGDAPLFAAVAERDAHVRLRAVRTAHREACSRAPSRLGRLACELQIRPDARGVRIDVDVQAPLIESCVRPQAAR